MPRLTNTMPNRFQAVSDWSVVSEEPLIAVLNMETDDGTIELMFNRTGIDHLIKELEAIRKEGDAA